MSLRTAPLLYVFYETSRLRQQRELFESVIGLPVVEIEPHLPHHRHGVFKYDAGGVILSHNLSGPSRFLAQDSDALVTVFGVPPAWSFDRLLATGIVRARPDGAFTDDEGRHFAFVPSPEHARSVVRELRLVVPALDPAVAFYRDVLDLRLLERTAAGARFATGTVPLHLDLAPAAPDGRRPRHESYLLVFLAGDIQATRAALADRGLAFKAPRVGYSEIGGTIRFDDPAGHRYCLYTPSEESLTWGSGSKVLEIAGARAAALR